MFTNNSASLSGGALLLNCSLKKQHKCKFNIYNSTFYSNRALIQGGAIAYNLYKPSINNSTF